MKIRCFKHRGKLTTCEKLCLSSFVHHHADVQLFSYDAIENLPSGVSEISAEEILPKSAAEFRFNSHSGIESLFRWKTLYEHGDCFVTLDMLCIRPLLFNSTVVFGKKSDVESYRWGADILIFPPGHAACEYMLDRCLHPHFKLEGDKLPHRFKKAFRKRFTRSITPVKPWKIGGEFGFQSAVEKFELSRFAQQPPVFYPVHEARWRTPFDRTFVHDLELLPMTRAIALNADASRRAGFNVELSPQKNSLAGFYANKYGVCA